MKNGSEVLAQPLDFEQPHMGIRRLMATAFLFLQRRRRTKLSCRNLVLSAAASLWIASLFLVGCYLFLHQLAEYGW